MMEKNERSLEARVADVEQRLAAVEEALRRATERGPASTPAAKSQSPKEFILEREPNSEVEASFLFGCYAEFIRNSGPFSVEDLRNLFQEARMRVPVNVNETINKNIAKGLFTPAREQKSGKKSWIVTLSGEQRFRKKDN